MFTRHDNLRSIALAALMALMIGAIGTAWTRSAHATHPEALFSDPESPVAGNPHGDVTLVEFFDYRCVYCRQFLDVMATVIKEDPEVRVVFKEFPIFGHNSLYAARAALASRNQDPAKYVEFHRALMRHRGALTEKQTLAIARDLGFDTERLAADMIAPAIDEAILRNHRVARQIGVEGTPSLIVGSHLVAGAVDAQFLRDLIAQTRQSRRARVALHVAD